jgi:hypothetical protein
VQLVEDGGRVVKVYMVSKIAINQHQLAGPKKAQCGSCWCSSEIESHTSHVIVHQRPHARDGSTLASKHLLEFVDNVEQDVVGGVNLERAVDVEEEEGIAGGEERHRSFQL